MKGDFNEGCLTEIFWNIRDFIFLYERMLVVFNVIIEIFSVMFFRFFYLYILDFSYNLLETLFESFGF